MSSLLAGSRIRRAVAAPPPAPTTPTAVAAPPKAPTTVAAIAPPPAAPERPPPSERVASPKKPEPKKPEPRKAEPKKPEPRVEAERSERAETARPKHNSKVSEVKAEALALYRAKNFSGAAAAITSALSQFSGNEAKDLRTIAATYSQLGKAYNIGMAPATKATEAFQALRRALNFDRDFGGGLSSEIQDKLVDKAPRAAMAYMASKEYESAFQAVRVAEQYGSTSSSNKAVRQSLEGIAGDLLRSAQAERSSDPESANKKLTQILGIVDSSNPSYQRAQKLLNGS